MPIVAINLLNLFYMFRKLIFDYRFLIIIVLFGALFRLYNINVTPYGFTWDEAAITYNAWGIAEWNRDEFGTRLPVSFRSFGDYKAPLMIYILGILYKIFDLQIWMTRWISALSGIAVIPAMYFLVQEIFFHSTQKKYIGLIAASLVAAQPFLINVSRAGFEATLGMLLIILGLYCLFRGLHQAWFWVGASFFLTLSLYAYHSPKIYVPILLLAFFIAYRKDILSKLTQVIASLVMGLGVSWLLIQDVFFAEGGQRSSTLIFFSESGEWQSLGQILVQFAHNIVNILHPSFLIFGEDVIGLRHMTPGFGFISFVTLLTLVLGFVYWLTYRKISKELFFSLTLIDIGILPSLLSQDNPHALRAGLALIGIILSTAYVYTKLPSKDLWKYAKSLLVVLFVGQLVFYLHTYHTNYVQASAKDFQYGYQQAVEKMYEYGFDKENMVMTDAYGQPYIYTLLYREITPKKYQYGALANVTFRSIKWPESEKNRVYIGTPEEIDPSDPNVVEVITVPKSEEIVFVIAVLD